jgi:hypothetical protein
VECYGADYNVAGVCELEEGASMTINDDVSVRCLPWGETVDFFVEDIHDIPKLYELVNASVGNDPTIVVSLDFFNNAVSRL